MGDSMTQSREGNPMVDHRSFSQIKQLKECGTAYRLARVDGASRIPAAWSIQGSAVHAAVEAKEWGADVAEIYAAFDVAWAEREEAALRDEPDMKKWQTGTPKRNGEVDAKQRREKGRQQVADYLAYLNESQDEVWRLPTGEPAAEVTFEIELGGVTVKGAIDLIVKCGDGMIRVRDIKTGSKLPEDPEQLGLYAVAANEVFGLNITQGDYYMCKSGTVTKPYDLTPYTREFFAAEFANADRIIREGLFTTRPGAHCHFCDVRPHCPIRGYKTQVPALEPFIP